MIPPSKESAHSTLTVLCLGNAGVNLADRLTVERSMAGEVIAVNSDSQSLMACVAPTKVQIGLRSTRGLGTGGDPDLGAEAVEENLDELLAYIEGRQVVVVAAGLGGGTGSGGAPPIAEAAKNAGAFVVGLVTRPFQFEGRRRQAQAREAEARLARYCDLLLIFENDRLSEIAEPSGGIHEAFHAADLLLQSAVESLARLIQLDGPMRLRFDDLLRFAAKCTPEAGLGVARAEGPNRANEAVEAALKAPLLNRDQKLDAAEEILVHFAAPADFSFVELQAAMKLIERHAPDEARITFGIGLSDESELSLAILAGQPRPEAVRRVSQAPETQPEPEPPAARQPEPIVAPEPAPERESEPATATASEPEPAPEVEPALLPLEAAPPPAEPQPEAPRPIPEATSEPVESESSAEPAAGPRKPMRAAAKKPAQPTGPTREQQQTLQFEPVARGRFEKSEPTIVEGEDLDVPTFLRLRLKTK